MNLRILNFRNESFFKIAAKFVLYTFNHQQWYLTWSPDPKLWENTNYVSIECIYGAYRLTLSVTMVWKWVHWVVLTFHIQSWSQTIKYQECTKRYTVQKDAWISNECPNTSFMIVELFLIEIKARIKNFLQPCIFD